MASSSDCMFLTITLPLCPHAPGGNQVWLHAFALSLRGAEMTRQPSLWVGAHAHASSGQWAFGFPSCVTAVAVSLT